MAIRTGPNAALGLPAFGVAFDSAMSVAPGTVVTGYDDTNDRTDEYIWLESPAAIVVDDDVTYDAAYVATEVAAGLGQADAIVASGAGQYAWFRLKPRPAAA